MNQREVLTPHAHLVSVGLPVYNGEAFVGKAIESILNQTHGHLELIISDNASTDGTERICRAYADRDDRIRYIRHPSNKGAAFNFNFVLDAARGDFVKWMAHDDVCRPRFIEACLTEMLRDPEVVLAYPTTMDIGPQGEELGIRDTGLGLDHDDPRERFRRTMRRAHRCLPVFGLVRKAVIMQTCKHGNYPAADRVLIGELALWGRLLEVPEVLFLHREHPARFSVAQDTLAAQVEWFDPTRSQAISMPTWRRLSEYLKAISRSPLTLSEKTSCRIWMVRWAVDLRQDLLSEIGRATRQWSRGRRRQLARTPRKRIGDS